MNTKGATERSDDLTDEADQALPLTEIDSEMTLAEDLKRPVAW